jgi:hypothetical protein
MNDIAEQRPFFFEGEYLGADDLQQLVVYLRDQAARHALGAHVWGIAAGLDLIEQPAPSGGSDVDVYLLPGYAVDGYGRAIIVTNPLRLTVDRFAGLTSGPVPVWIRYDQGGTKGVRPGFEVCTAENAFARIAESFEITAGLLTAVIERQSGISVASEPVDDAREAGRLFNDKGGIVCDASVPYQDLPLQDETKQWWIPLGLVGWSSGVPGKFRALTDDERVLSRRQRHYLGVVAENLLAADGLIRLRRRDTAVPAGKTTDEVCGPDDPADPSHDADFRLCQEHVHPTELVWIEGRLRVTDDTRLLGARLEFRDAAGTDYLPSGAQPGSVPLLFQRDERSGNADLRLLIGTAKAGTSNRLVIADAGTPTAGAHPCAAVHFDKQTVRVVVQDDGKVGIGTDAPDRLLHVEGADKAFIHVGAKTGPSDLFLGADKDGAAVAAVNANDLRLTAGGADPGDDDPTKVAFVVLKPTGHIGIGTKDPDTQRLVTLETKNATYLIARTNPDSPGTPKEVLLGADSAGAIVSAMTPNTDLVLRGGNNNTAIWIKDDARVGVGTSTPQDRLDVRGNVRLGFTGELLAAGSGDNLRIIAGAVSSGGSAIAGGGFTSSRSSTGRYHVSFSTSFPVPPVVLANSIDAVDDDDFPMVKAVTANGFDVHMTDVSGNGDTTVLEDDAFSFVVLGLR